MNSLNILFLKKHQTIIRTNMFSLLNKNGNHMFKRTASTENKNNEEQKKNVEENVYKDNCPKGIRIPIMRYFYGLIFLMAFVPITQSLYETNKYYKENEHLYEKGKN
ncbi:conserved Plasmodium protein, unknown function [Plasmodium gaboni]|uniref:Uncharacterized protein n=1 Tax=Plasmodium gaboni TaxID=647221 RepID=A0ABY1UJC0_9APIC|nr:conserved Plasmodium protein, unknown function [Plasmodium gaboni]